MGAEEVFSYAASNVFVVRRDESAVRVIFVDETNTFVVDDDTICRNHKHIGTALQSIERV